MAGFTPGMEDLVFNANGNRSGLTAAGKTGNTFKKKLKHIRSGSNKVKDVGSFCSCVKAVCVVCIYTRAMDLGLCCT